MPRSPSDATRFTSTGPYAASSSSFASNPPATHGTRISFGEGPPDGETPQQKIARLRNAAALAKTGKESRFDRVVLAGRAIADRAHRFTAISLIGFTVVSAMVATAGIGDMMLHNRRRRSEWLAEQQAKSGRDLLEAQRAQKEGRATEDQVLLINRERAAFEAAEAKKNRPGIFKRSTSWLFSGVSSEEQKGGRLGAGAGPPAIGSINAPKEELLVDRAEETRHQAVEQKREAVQRSGGRVEDVLRPLGGPLDRQAEHTVGAIASAGRSWTSWITGK